MDVVQLAVVIPFVSDALVPVIVPDSSPRPTITFVQLVTSLAMEFLEKKWDALGVQNPKKNVIMIVEYDPRL